MATSRVFSSRFLQSLTVHSPSCRLPSLVRAITTQRALSSSSSAVAPLTLTRRCLSSTLVALRPPFAVTGGFRSQHQIRCFSKYDKELVEFLDVEISTENRDGSMTKLPTHIGGFDVKLNQAEISLVRNVNGEKVTVTLSVNAPIDGDDEALSEEDDVGEVQHGRRGDGSSGSVHAAGAANDDAQSQHDRLPSTFTVDIEHGRKTVSFTCSFLHEPAMEEANDEYTDHFCIDEIVMFEGEISDSCYTVSGSSIPADMYDLLMNTLEDRGIDSKFAQELIDFCTNYEQRCYVALLQGLHSFYSKH